MFTAEHAEAAEKTNLQTLFLLGALGVLGGNKHLL
jgi:hypothetical protein